MAGRGRLSGIDMLPEEAQDDVAWAVKQLNARVRTAEDIRFELNDRLEVKGIPPISKSAFNRKSMKLAAAANRLAEARYMFDGLADQFTPDKVDENSIVLSEMIKLLIFELAQEEGSERTPKQAMELANAHLAVIRSQSVSADRRSKLEAEFAEKAGKAIDEVAKAKGLSDELRQDLRRDLFGVAPPKPRAT